jgi:hypothetical protein
VAGDFNADGHLDLAVANAFDNTVSVLLGKGDGTFQPQVTYAVGGLPDAIVAGDFAGDGHLDLAAANKYDNTVSVLLGNGNGTFQPQVTYPVGTGPDAIAAGDLTGRGRLDLAVAYGAGFFDPTANPGGVSILLGNGDGTFQPAVSYPVGFLPDAVAAGDFTGGAQMDIAVTSQASGTVSILRGRSDGTFKVQATYSAVVHPTAVVPGAFAGGGHSDLAVYSQQQSSVSMFLGNGDGTFQPQLPESIQAGLFPYSLVAGDFTGSGRLGLAARDTGQSTAVTLGNGDGTFQSPLFATAGPSPSYVFDSQSIVAGDFNGDGRLDLAAPNQSTNTVSVLLGNGDGTFQPQVTYAVGQDPSAIVVGDFTGDGLLDLAVANYNDDTASVLMGNGDGTFQPQVVYSVGQQPDAIAMGDFTGEGHLDLAIADCNCSFFATGDGSISILLGNGDGTFQPQVLYAAGQQPDAITAGDFASNGHLDLAVVNSNESNSQSYGPAPGSVSVLLGNGDGTFQPQAAYPVGAFPEAVVAGVFAGEGHLDLAVANLTDGSVSVLPGNGDGTFQPQVAYPVGEEPGSIVAADFYGNGHVDLATANQGSSDISVLVGNGDGTFSDPSQFATAPHATPLLADVNGDGTDDVLVIDGHGNILYRQGVPGQPGSFEPPVTINPGAPSRDIVWVPRTEQGPVLASVDAHDNFVSLYAWRNGHFARVGSLATGRLPAQIIAADLNGDGWTDLVVRNAGDGTLSVFFNDQLGSLQAGTLPFQWPVTLPAGIGVSDVQAIDTTGSGKPDLVVTNKLTGQVSISRNLGDGTFAPLEPYRAGTGLSAIDTRSGSAQVTSLEATAGVAAGAFTLGGPSDLVTMNPGSETLGVLAGWARDDSPIPSRFTPGPPGGLSAPLTSTTTASPTWPSSPPAA